MHQDLLFLEAQNGNEKAFECWVAIFHPQLVNFAGNLSSNHALTEDAVQDVWIRGRPFFVKLSHRKPNLSRILCFI
jgi:DNA-directed RNA polymerase specialized sigma24 family protein